MRNKSKYYNLIFGFLIGFSLSIIGMAIEDIQFQIPIKFFLRESHHLYAPIIIGVLKVSWAISTGVEQKKKLGNN